MTSHRYRARGAEAPPAPQHRLPARRRPARRRGWRLVLVTLLSAATLVGAAALLLPRAATPTPPALTVGDCLTGPRHQPRSVVGCDQPAAYGTVIAVASGGLGQNCPVDTDEIVGVDANVACVRALRGSHAGAPGQGGGVIRAGDCVSNPSTGRTTEVRCTATTNYAQVLARTDTESHCPLRAAEAVRIVGADTPTLCLEPRAGVGSCLGTAVLGAPDPVSCGDPEATGRILARTAEQSACPAGTRHTLTALFGLPQRRTVCLAAPR